jgi:uncharacterized protein YerC
VKSKGEVEDFFNDLLTPTERIVLAKRLAIAILLAKGYGYAAIRKTLHVSPPTIATVSIALRYKGEGYRRVVNKLLKEETIKDFLLEVVDSFATIGSVGGKGSYGWLDVRRRIRKKRNEKPF